MLLSLVVTKAVVFTIHGGPIIVFAPKPMLVEEARIPT
jgi:hypothetical protein